MAPNSSVARADHCTPFIEAKVLEGRHSSASDMIRGAAKVILSHIALAATVIYWL